MSHPEGPVWDAICGISRFAALSTMAELGWADHLADGPLSVEELALRSGSHAPALRRVLRELAGMGLVRSSAPDVYELTEDGQTLRTDVPGSLRSAVRMIGEEGFWFAMGNLPATVRQGSSAFVERSGPLYRYLAENPASGRIFDDYMTARATPFAAAVAGNYDFSGVRTLVDVAGGRGHILAEVLAAYPETGGVLFDLAHVVEGAKAAMAARGLADRVEFVPGDFFAAVPRGADAYLLSSILHNWDDHDAVRILRNVRESMSADGRVLVLEMVLPDDDAPHIGKDIDMRMLALFEGGAERSRHEYAGLLEKAGLKLTGVTELTAGASLVEARPA